MRDPENPERVRARFIGSERNRFGKNRIHAKRSEFPAVQNNQAADYRKSLYHFPVHRADQIPVPVFKFRTDRFRELALHFICFVYSQYIIRNGQCGRKCFDALLLSAFTGNADQCQIRPFL